VVFSITKIALVMLKMHINVNFLLKFFRTHNNVSQAKTLACETMRDGHSNER